MALSKIPADLITGGLSVDPAAPADAITVDSSGNVGVGTSSPETLLHLKSTTSGAPQLRLEGTGADNGIITWLGGGHANPAVGIRYISTGDSIGNLAFYANSSSSSTLSERMRIDSAGRVTMPYQPFMSGGRSAGDVSNAVFIMNDLDWNRGNHYNTSTGLFTCPVTGVYGVQFSVMTSPSYSGAEDMFSIAINGSNKRNHYRTTTGVTHQRVDGFLLWYATANDTISFVARVPTIYGSSKTHSYGNIWLVG